MPALAHLTARELADEAGGWVIDASWPDRQSEQLLGVFTTLDLANDWIANASQAWRSAPRQE